MKKQISIAILLITTILFNGCFSTSYMQKAPSERMWDKSKEFKTCDDSQMPVALYRFYSYSNMLFGGINTLASLTAKGDDATSLLTIGGLQLVYGLFQYTDSQDAIKETQKCKDYKTFMLSK